MKTVRWGVIGPGGIANKFVAAINSSANATVVACASKTLGTALAFQQKHSLQRAYGSYEELAGSDEIDAVYIANTHNFHYGSAKLCLERGKHVLCEKAFTVNARQARELMNLAAKNNLFLMEAMWTRFLPTTRWVREQLAKGEIGEVVHVEAGYSREVAYNPASRLFNKALAGGSLLDLGIYPLSFVCMVLGTAPIKIASVATLAENGVDDQGIISLLYEGKKTALIRQGFCYTTTNHATIYGTKGNIFIPDYCNAKSAVLTRADNSVVNFEHSHENGFVFEAAEAIDMILQGKKESALLPVLETVRIMELCDKLRAEWGVSYDGE